VNQQNQRDADIPLTGFDITTILDFQPPRLICPTCRGLMSTVMASYKVRPFSYTCPRCGEKYLESDADASDGRDALREHLNAEGCVIDHGTTLLAHARALAKVIRNSRGTESGKPWPTARTLFEVISRARYFIHFASYGMSHQIIGALKLASTRVPVYGWASNVDANTRAELTEYPNEAPKLIAKVIPSDQSVFDAPHQKLLVVDGLVAFKGSANLTNAGLRKADRGLDISEVVTDYAQVTRLNNTYFAPVWRRISAPEDAFAWPAEA
jgi:Phospholipase D Active site motif